MSVKDYAEMTVEELQAKLKELEDDLLDAKDLREMQLGQEGQHINSRGLTEKYDNIEKDLNEKIEKVKKYIEEKN